MKVEIDGNNCDINVINFLACPLLVSPTSFRLTENEMDLVLDCGFNDIVVEDKDKAVLGSGVKTSQNNQLLNQPGLERVRSFMVTLTQRFVSECLKIEDEFYLTTSWATKNVKGAAHHAHTHPNTLLSAVYYAESQSGDLTISSNTNGMFPNFDFKWNLSEFNNFNSRSWVIPVRTGDIVVFPGWLNHYGTRNLHDTPRIAVGANFFTRGTFGQSDGVNLINVG